MKKWWKNTTHLIDTSQKISSKLSGAKYKRKTLFDRKFKGKYIKRRKSGCWEWTGTISKNGYGVVSWRGKVFGAHRMSYELHNGKIGSSDIFVCHSCDNRLCINPDHLWLGTNHDNMVDMMKKVS